MTRPELIVRGRRIVLPDGERAASIHVAGGRITRVADFEDAPSCATFIDAADFAVLPGLVDAHVHVNEPGRTAWEGFETATRAAAAGGIATIVDMPLNSIPATTTLQALHEKVAAATGKAAIDFALWGGVVPGNAGELEPMLDAGVAGFKCFLVDSGVPEFERSDAATLESAMPILARRNSPLLVHAELPGPIANASCCAPVADGDPRRHATFLAGRPRAAENEAITMMISLARRHGTRVHIVHLSSSDALDAIRKAREQGVLISAETCPHYLSFDAEDIPDGRTEFKCCPPIREAENREKLWRGLGDGTLSLVVSDHSPSPPAMKRLEEGDFIRAWGGVASVQFSLSATWTGARERGFRLADIARWMSASPAALAGLLPRKGELRPGADADFVLFDPEAEYEVSASTTLHRHALSPYLGRRLRGVVQKTYVRGRLVYDRGRDFGPPAGEWQKPGPR